MAQIDHWGDAAASLQPSTPAELRATRSARDLPPGEGILCLALRRWYETWKSNQQVASILSESNRVLYVGPPIPLREAITQTLAREARRPILQRISDNLIVYNEPRFLARARIVPQVNWATTRLRIWHVRHLAQRLLGDSPILWVFDPLVAPLLRGFKTKLLVYHIIDDYASYFHDSAGRMRSVTARCEERMLAEADLVFAVSEMLHQRALTRNPNSFLVPNGVDYELFASAVAHPMVPADVISISRPIIGYVGVIQRTMDFGLLDNLAAEHLEWSFVFVGPMELGDQTAAFHALLRRRNVHYLGAKPVSSVPYYIEHFDVCIMPDRERPGTDTLKIYEYLACGRPIVALDSASVRRFRGLVEIVRQGEEFADAIQRSLGESTNLSEARMRVARTHSWRGRVEAMGKVIHDRLRETGGAGRAVLLSVPERMP